MALRVDVWKRIPDARADSLLRSIERLPRVRIPREVVIADSYSIDASLAPAAARAAALALTDQETEAFKIGRYAPKGFSYAIEIGFLPGVTDNVGNTATETIEDTLKRKFKAHERAYSSQVFFFFGTLSHADAAGIAASLHNPLIQGARIWSASEFAQEKKRVVVPKVSLSASASITPVNLEISDADLVELGKRGIKNADGSYRGPLALDLESLHAIREHFRALKRSPTDAELEMLAQTWSEHCKHTIFANPIDDIDRGIYKTYIKGATEAIRKKKGKKDFCVSVFHDNAGGIVFDEKHIVTHKVETHNSPSALDPFGGAVTGVVGVNRDTIGFGLGAKPVANVYGFCFAPPEDSRKLFRDRAQTQEMLSARAIAEGVIKGINAGGNQSGIPTPNGFMLFDESYRGKPLVFAGTVGLIPRTSGGRKLFEKKARSGDYIVMVGGRVGVDGIHGATFSSVSIDSGSPATAVQIGDPITQKKLSDAIIKEARDMGLYTSITDCGAGGLSSAVGEMARESGGCRVDLAKVPLKYPGLEPWQIWISESQERMALAVPKAKWKAFSSLMTRRGVEATVIGEFTNTGVCEVFYGKKRAVSLSLTFLHDGLPKRDQHSRQPHYAAATSVKHPGVLQKGSSLREAVLGLLGSNNLASREFLARQYDHEVQSGSVQKPLQGSGRVDSDAAVFRPVLTSPRAVVLSSALTPHYGEIDPYAMAAAAIDTAVRNAVAAGAPLGHLALLDNFCWCSSDEPERLWQLKEAARACYDTAVAYGTPFISGKDSMFNDFKGFDEQGHPVKISALPTLLISAIAVMKDAARAVSLDPKVPGDLVYLLGDTHDEMGGSEYARLSNITGVEVPRVDVKKNLARYRTLEKAISQGLIASSVSLGRGGLAHALTRSFMAGGKGIRVDLSKVARSAGGATQALFSESQGRILVTVSPKSRAAFEKLFAGQSIQRIGTVEKGTSLSIAAGSAKFTISLRDALAAYRKRFKNW